MNAKKRKAVIDSLALDGSIKLAADRSRIDAAKVASLVRSDEEAKAARARGLERQKTKARDDLEASIRVAELEVKDAESKLQETRREFFKKAGSLDRDKTDFGLRTIARLEASLHAWRERRQKAKEALTEWKEDHGF